jgi:hypothetical protein
MYSVDYNQKVIETLVPDKRQPKTVAFLQQLAKEVSGNHNQLFTIYKGFQSPTIWSAGTYTKNTVVRYAKSIYLAAENTNAEPSFSNVWILVSPNFMGNDFRLAIRGEKLNLEYALNTWFNTTFRQPPLVSDIYLSTNVILDQIFRVGINENESSNIYKDISSEFVINNYLFTDQYNLTINVPLSVYNALGSTTDIRTSIIRNFANLYISAGITYNIITY